MIVDTSAVMAILFDEPSRPTLSRTIREARQPKIAAPTLLELFIVADQRLTPALRPRIDIVLQSLRLAVVPFGLEHARVAREAYRAYGRGSGSPARLNFGDCFSYALAAVSGEPLLFVGDDFTHTDIRPAK